MAWKTRDKGVMSESYARDDEIRDLKLSVEAESSHQPGYTPSIL